MRPLSRHWRLDPAVTFLNHGSFGACPLPVLERQAQLREQMEAEPVRFFTRELEPLLDAARTGAAAFVGCDPADFAFLPNATAGVNAVLRSLDLRQGDELLTTDHAYNACRNALEHRAEAAGAQVVVARVPFPLRDEGEVVAAVLARVTGRTRLALLDHVTSPTGLVLPVGELVAALAARGVDSLVDGAHAPGMLPLSVRSLGAAYYTGNFHKWTCAPKGAAFLWVRPDRQVAVRPLSISHGANSPRTDRSRFRLEFDWTGTADPTAYLCVPEALRFMASLVPGGWPEVMRQNHGLAVAGRGALCAALGVEPPCPSGLLGSLASLPLPDGPAEPLQDALLQRFAIEVPIVPWPAAPRRLVRISAQLYNAPEEYERLGGALTGLL
ncbi:MAG: aminotransferase class V-fold PLP-dependent enzyme [Myxococcaceae bacterium]